MIILSINGEMDLVACAVKERGVHEFTEHGPRTHASVNRPNYLNVTRVCLYGPKEAVPTTTQGTSIQRSDIHPTMYRDVLTHRVGCGVLGWAFGPYGACPVLCKPRDIDAL